MPTTHIVAVDVAQVWASPEAPRPIDSVAVQSQPNIAGWMSLLDGRSRLDLMGRIETQALFGEPVLVVGERDGWSEVRIPDQPTSKDPNGYPGWIRSDHLALTDSVTDSVAETVMVSRRFAALRSVTLEGGRPRGDRIVRVVSIGSRFGVIDHVESGAVVDVPGGGRLFIDHSDYAVRTDPLDVASDFVGLAYLWSGLSGWGVDCSGLVHLSNRVAGFAVARDSVDQFVDGVPGAVFFGYQRGHVHAGRIHHVGFDLGNGLMLHAPKTGWVVEVLSLDTEPYRSELLRPPPELNV
jgi:gamma-D-glutamyl-L-lysine dipeptidyl-peptidase